MKASSLVVHQKRGWFSSRFVLCFNFRIRMCLLIRCVWFALTNCQQSFCLIIFQLKECSIPLTPVWFSTDMLVAMDKIVPSHLPSPVDCTAVPNVKKVIWIQVLSVDWGLIIIVPYF